MHGSNDELSLTVRQGCYRELYWYPGLLAWLKLKGTGHWLMLLLTNQTMKQYASCHKIYQWGGVGVAGETKRAVRLGDAYTPPHLSDVWK